MQGHKIFPRLKKKRKRKKKPLVAKVPAYVAHSESPGQVAVDYTPPHLV